LTASAPATEAYLGYGSAISGSTIVAGAYGHAVYVFTEPAGGWVNGQETGELTASDGGAGFGFANAISGLTIVGGAPEATVNGNVEQGAVYVFGVPVLPHVPISGIETGLEPTVVILEPGGRVEIFPGDAAGPPIVFNEDDPEEDDSESR
jgi:hypothetical protein